jgi:signal transduction histidine kinase
MSAEEDRLLAERQAHSAGTFMRVRSVLGVTFGLVLVILIMDFRRLNIELNQRKEAEAAVRRLSARVLQMQDAERRKVARELHDSIGQYFASLAMNMEMLRDSAIAPAKREQLLAESLEMLKQGSAETRTLSYLLHPPLLDEAGFVSAARWYVDGFAERSKIDVSLEVDPQLGRVSPVSGVDALPRSTRMPGEHTPPLGKPPGYGPYSSQGRGYPDRRGLWQRHTTSSS